MQNFSILSVIKNIHETIGFPMLPPYWSLGYHLSRWGYRSSNDVIDIVEEMKSAKIPLEVQWVDIDYMEDHKGRTSVQLPNNFRIPGIILTLFSDFTVDSVNWASMKNLSDLLHENDQRFVLILDPAIPSEAGPDYKPVRDQ